MSLPRVTPMPLARFDSPFVHPDWIFEPKLDGFRDLAYRGGRRLLIGTAALVARKLLTDPDATTWVKIKNRQYSQAIGRADFFNGRKPLGRASTSEPGRR